MKYLLFLVIGILVVFPWLLHPGYLLLLDWQGAPDQSLVLLEEGSGVSGIPVRLVLFLFSFISPLVSQSLAILLILMTAGYGMTRFLTHILPRKTPFLIPITGGIFFMLNLFVYNRLEMGHMYLLAGYALLPYVASEIRRFLQKPSLAQGLCVSMLGSLTVLTSIHFIFLLPLLLAIIIWDTEEKKRVSLPQVAVALLPCLFTCLLVGGILLAHPSSSLHGISQASRTLFAPQPQCSSSLILDTTLLVSQWRNPVATQAPCSSPFLFLLSILLLTCIAVGAFSKKKLFVGAALCVLLAIIPFIPALRDSAKFLAPLAFLESILLGYGMLRLVSRFSIPPLLFFVLVLGSSYPFFSGLSGTIQTHMYPESWYVFNEQLSLQEEKPSVLFLPWHLYMPFDFTNQASIGNPAKKFFTNATSIQGDNLEMSQGIERSETQSSRPISHAIEQVLATRTTPAFSSLLKDLLTREHISFIALSHGSPEEEEYKKILNKLSYLRPFYEAPGISVWQFGE